MCVYCIYVYYIQFSFSSLTCILLVSTLYIYLYSIRVYECIVVDNTWKNNIILPLRYICYSALPNVKSFWEYYYCDRDEVSEGRKKEDENVYYMKR